MKIADGLSRVYLYLVSALLVSFDASDFLRAL